MTEDRVTAPLRSLDILVPTRDRSTRLTAMLSSLAAQEPPPGRPVTNLYLLDNGATSAFADFDVARQLDVLQARGVQTFYLRRPHFSGVYAVRRHLYEAGHGDVVLYVDDDVALPAGTLTRLWEGIERHGFSLAANLVIDVDGLHDGEIGYGRQAREVLLRIADEIERDDLAAVGDEWVEMVSPFGTNLMFRRNVFDRVGAWTLLEPFFAENPGSWGEDIGVCVALKSEGEAFIDVSRTVLHLTPRERSFAGWQTPEGLSNLLRARFGVDHPGDLTSRLRSEGGGAVVANRLRAATRGQQP